MEVTCFPMDLLPPCRACYALNTLLSFYSPYIALTIVILLELLFSVFMLVYRTFLNHIH